MITKFQVKHWAQNSYVKVFRPRKHLSGHAQTFPPGYRNIKETSHRLQGGARAKQEQF